MAIPKPLTLSPPADAVSATLTVTGDIASVHLIATGDASVDVSYEIAAPPPPVPEPFTDEQAARFLQQAALSQTLPEIQAVRTAGIAGWLKSQFAMPRKTTFWDYCVAQGWGEPRLAGVEQSYDTTIHRHMIKTEEHLRTRVSLALASFLVIGAGGVPTIWRPFSMAAYLDILADNAFGNYRDILEGLARSPIMAWYLTFLNNKKADGAGRTADENWARELMQLFSIGPVLLAADGTPTTVPSYDLSDIGAISRVFTGWTSQGPMTVGDYKNRKPDCILIEADHDLGEKRFLGGVIPAYVSGSIRDYADRSLDQTIDILFAHKNCGPFVVRRLIQRLVTSNPTPGYIARVASVFDDNGQGERGDLMAVVTAILTDREARDAPSEKFGKLTEPVLRFYQWARTFNAHSPSGTYPIYASWDSSRMSLQGQWVGHPPGVFGHSRPGYVPPNSRISELGLVAPDFQLVSEMSTITWVNWMQVIMRDGSGDFQADYSEWLGLATADAVARLNLCLAAGRLSPELVTEIVAAADMAPNPKEKIMAVTLLVMASPQYLVAK